MPRLAAASTHLSETELSELDSLLRRRSPPQQIALSLRHVGRLLKEADLKPHQSRYWLPPRPRI